jgi:hypothetical protein
VNTVDSQAVNPIDDHSHEAAEGVDAARLELKLCRTLAALNPPRDLSLMVQTRAAELLRVLRNHTHVEGERRKDED